MFFENNYRLLARAGMAVVPLHHISVVSGENNFTIEPTLAIRAEENIKRYFDLLENQNTA